MMKRFGVPQIGVGRFGITRGGQPSGILLMIPKDGPSISMLGEVSELRVLVL